MSDEYEHVARGKLKLKTDSNKISKKQKKKDQLNWEKLQIEHESYQQKKIVNASQSVALLRTKTKAELSFKKMQDKMVRIEMKKRFIFLFAHFSCALFCQFSARKTYSGKGITNA